MKMYKAAAITGMFVWSVTCAQTLFADGVLPPDPVARRLEGLTWRLNLTPAQQDAVRLILEDEAGKMKLLRDNSTRTMAEREPEIQELRDLTTANISAVLTADQLAQQAATGGQ